MVFGESAHLRWQHSLAPREDIVQQVVILTAILGSPDRNVARALTSGADTQQTLAELKKWNARLANNPYWDRIGLAARRFWAAQTLSTTILSQFALDQTYPDNPDLIAMMQSGADGLWEVGHSQFQCLARALP
jgi:hypothetical protein